MSEFSLALLTAIGLVFVIEGVVYSLFPNGMKGEINYILLGMHLKRSSIGIIPQIRFNPGLIRASFRMTWGIG